MPNTLSQTPAVPDRLSVPSGSLAERMVDHERRTRQLLPKGYAIVRVDGRAFSNFTRGLERPFDRRFAGDMDAVAVALCTEMSGAVVGYAQSDEVSVLLTDFSTATTQAWFGGVVAKITSLSAARATLAFHDHHHQPGRYPDRHRAQALFDARVFALPDAHEVAAYFLWRQRDAARNAVQMAAHAHFSHRRLQGLGTAALRDLLATEAGVRFEDYPEEFRRGRVITKGTHTEGVTYTHRRTGEEHIGTAIRSRWEARSAPQFSTDPNDWLRAHVIPTRAGVDVEAEQ